MNKTHVQPIRVVHEFFYFPLALSYDSDVKERTVLLMDSVTLLLLACGLAMDAFAVSLSNGLCYQNFRRSQAILSAVTFGVFQAVMPVVGYFAGRFFSRAISSVDHWIAFILLGLIGGHMLAEAIREMRHPEGCPEKRPFTLRILLIQGIATSIDALAVGVSFALIDTNIAAAAAIIGIVTCALCLIGAAIGKRFGAFLGQRAKLLGGAILIAIGLKILIEHMTGGA